MDTYAWDPTTQAMTPPQWQAAVALAGIPTVAWHHGESAQQAWGFGVAAQRVGASIPEAGGLILALVRSPGVERDGLRAPGPWFGGLAFPGGLGSPAWQGFAPVRFVLPRLLLWRVGDQCFQTRFAAPEQHANPQVEVAAVPPITGVIQDRAHWDALVSRATLEIAHDGLQKVVAARAITVTASHAWDVQSVVTHLLERWPTTRVFAVQGTHGSTVVGATPETLLRLHGNILEVDALAGSAAPDGVFGPKERAEHRHVVDGIVAALTPHCVTVNAAPQPGERVLPNIRHLHTPVRATFRGVDNLPAALSSLFPTAAVAGTPRGAALDFLARHEDLDRGWYAGAVGTAGGGEAHLCVTLRCALLQHNTARLFVGAGLVSGSTPQAEWDETAHKARPMLNALGVTP